MEAVMKEVLIIGSGLSGLSCAIRLAQNGIPSIVVSPYPSERAQSVMAAGGINAALGADDSQNKHAKDTWLGGCEIAGMDAVAGLCSAAPEIIRYLEELGVTDSGINRMIKSVYDLLNLITYITAGEKEVHAWTITRGTKAPQAAGVIHTDFEKGFIRAEVTSYKDFVECGSYTACKDKGVTRLEGKEYIVQDGDIVHFRFAV